MLEPLENTTAVSGQDCPQSGRWRALGTTVPPLLVAKGNIMPAVDAWVVTWVLMTSMPAPHVHKNSAPE